MARQGLTPKQEDFCTAYVETGNASEAYRRAYPKALKWKPETVHKRASELLANGDVLGRIAAIKEAHQQRHHITIDKLTADAYEAIELSKSEGQAGAFVSAVKLLAQLHGLLVKRHEIKGGLALTEEQQIILKEIEKRADDGLG